MGDPFRPAPNGGNRPVTPTFDNLAILASAGTGKTFQLTHRFIHLLGHGVPPDRICAMTFSRKAAGEIYSELLAHLLRAARDPEAAARTARLADVPGFDPTMACRMLGLLLRAPQTVHIGTLDRFFVAVLRAFSPELGIPPDFVLAESDSPEIRRLSLRILATLDRARQQAFLSLVREASYGRDEPSFFQFLEGALQNGLSLFTVVPDPAAWGQARRLWPQRPLWLRLGLFDAPRNRTRDLETIESHPFPKELKRILGDFARTLARARPFHPIEIPRSKAIDALVTKWEHLHHGLDFRYRQASVVLPPEVGAAFQRLLSRPLLYEMLRVRRQTRGLGRLFHWFLQEYDEFARRSGLFTFDDVQRFLSPRWADRPTLSRRPDASDRLYLDYRLDARLDHWLLDEFQDTSDLQWSVLENLADEIIQDHSGTRSFFIVGDVKQAIYGWRQGNARLMGTLLARYGSGHPRAFRLRHLVESFRSSQPVLDAVNAIFNRVEEERRLPETTRAFWQAFWKPHQAHDAGRPGCAAWLEWAGGTSAGHETDDETEDEEAPGENIHRAMAAVIRDLDPAARALSVAVLLRTNAECRATAEALRFLLKDEAIPIANEGASEIARSPAAGVMRALLRYAAHPGDTLALGHLRMSPLRAFFEAPNAPPPCDLLATLQNHGFLRFLREWESRLEAAMPEGLSAYDVESLAALKALALDADQKGVTNVDLFLETVESRQKRDLDDRPGVVRVMTIHQSKGLGFDAVLVPFPRRAAALTATPPGGLSFLTGGSRESPWVLKSPGEPWRRMDPALRQSLEEAASQTAFENLCLLYVALTRARNGLYLFSDLGLRAAERRSDKEPAFSALRLAAEGLLGTSFPEEVEGDAVDVGGQPLRRIMLMGEWNWAVAIPRSAFPAEPLPPPPAGEIPRSRVPARRLRLVEPSEEETRIWGVRWLLSREAEAVRRFGDAIHALLARLSWLDETDPDRIIAEWRPSPSLEDAVRREAIRQFRALFEKREIRAAFERPAEPVWLWREKPFEFVAGAEWISGVFDRVVVRLDVSGRPREAEILDFKSARVEDAAEAVRAALPYRPQMLLYRRALAGLLNLPPERIAVRLLFTRPAVWVPIS